MQHVLQLLIFHLDVEKSWIIMLLYISSDPQLKRKKQS